MLPLYITTKPIMAILMVRQDMSVTDITRQATKQHLLLQRKLLLPSLLRQLVLLRHQRPRLLGSILIITLTPMRRRKQF